MSRSEATVPVLTYGQIGAFIGGTCLGYLSTFTGRRLISTLLRSSISDHGSADNVLIVLTACVIGGALIPAYVLPHDNSLIASSFFLQFFGKLRTTMTMSEHTDREQSWRRLGSNSGPSY